jgi:TonB family protein
MNHLRKNDRPQLLKNVGRILLQGAALAFVLVLAMPVTAADGRAVKSRVAPVYPEIAKRLRISGTVKLEATIDTEGTVKDVKAVSGNGMLVTAAEDAVRKWKYSPASEESTVTIAVDFSANQ